MNTYQKMKAYHRALEMIRDDEVVDAWRDVGLFVEAVFEQVKYEGTSPAQKMANRLIAERRAQQVASRQLKEVE